MQEKNVHSQSFAERLRLMMERKGMSQHDLAERLGTTQSTIQGWLAGATPRRKILFEMATILNVNVQWLLTGEGKEQPDSKIHIRTLHDHQLQSQSSSVIREDMPERFDSEWKRRALGAEARLLQLRHQLLNLADNAMPPSNDSRLTDEPETNKRS